MIPQNEISEDLRRRRDYNLETYQIIEDTKSGLTAEWSIAGALSALARIAFMKNFPSDEPFPESEKLEESGEV